MGRLVQYLAHPRISYESNEQHTFDEVRQQHKSNAVDVM